MRILVLDIGGNHVKVLLSGQKTPTKIPTGPKFKPEQLVRGVKSITKHWRFDAISIGFPAPVLRGKIIAEPYNLGRGWVGFDFVKAFGCPVKVLNDASMQAIGSYEGGKMLFLGLGTGLGSAMIVDGLVEPCEIGHLPYRKKTFEAYVGRKALAKFGKKKWKHCVKKVVAALQKALEPDYVVLGGGNVELLKKLPRGCRRGRNANAFRGGILLWEQSSDSSNALKAVNVAQLGGESNVRRLAI